MKSFLLTLCMLSVILQFSHGEGWQTLGANSQHNGRGDVSGPLAPDIHWQGTTESTWFGCQCYISGTRMVTMRFQGVDVSPIVCYDVDSGQELWSLDFAGQKSRSMPLGFRDNRIYTVNYQENSGGDDLYALDPADGSTLWVAPAMVRDSSTRARSSSPTTSPRASSSASQPICPGTAIRNVPSWSIRAAAST